MKKKLLYLFAITGLLIVSCNPMEDINKEIENNKDADYVTDTFIINRDVAPEAYTLLDEDYELSSNEGVAKYKNFSEYALPKDYLPEILNKKFTSTDAFEMQVTYDYYSKLVVDEENAYIVDTDEYAEMGQSYPNFGDVDVAEDLIGKMLDRKVYADEVGVEMTAQYNLFLTNVTRYIKVNSDMSTEVLGYGPDGVYELDSADYAIVGYGEYQNFYDLDDAQEKLVDIAVDKKDTLPKDYACTVYKNYYEPYVVYIYSETNWLVKKSTMPTTEPLNYALDEDNILNSYWWADPAIKIALGADDYALYPETAKYSNFDLRSGSVPGVIGYDVVNEIEVPNAELLTMILMVGGMLDANHDPQENQQYLVSYAYYDGANGIGTLRLIKTDGVWEGIL